MSNERSQFDMKMKEMFNSYRENYHAPPWPGQRTQSDQELQKTWCPNCENKPNLYVEGYAPLSGFRTEYDRKLQQQWCPKCKHY